MDENYKIGVIGPKEVVMGFLSLGFMVESVTNHNMAADSIEKLKNNGCAIVYITGDFYEKIDTSAYKTDSEFTVIPIPTHLDTSDMGRKRLKKFVEKAVGADILFNK